MVRSIVVAIASLAHVLIRGGDGLPSDFDEAAGHDRVFGTRCAGSSNARRSGAGKYATYVTARLGIPRAGPLRPTEAFASIASVASHLAIRTFLEIPA